MNPSWKTIFPNSYHPHSPIFHGVQSRVLHTVMVETPLLTAMVLIPHLPENLNRLANIVQKNLFALCRISIIKSLK